MSAKIYLNLLILCSVLCQGIIGTLSEKDVDESSDILVRKKRVINMRPGEDKPEQIKNFAYVVSIKSYRAPVHCVGVILTNLIALTVAECVEIETAENYRVYSGTARASLNGRYVTHYVTEKRILVDIHPYRPEDGIALITVYPPFVYSLNTKNIQIYEGYIKPGALGTIIGWGCNAKGHPGTAYPDFLRSITVPIINYQDCAILYLDSFAISKRDICTLDTTGSQYCSVGDTGAPLVIKVGGANQLVGVYLWKGKVLGGSNPDVFVNLQNSRYKTWIRKTILDLEEHLNNPKQNQHLPNNLHNQENLRHLHNLPHQPNTH